MSLPEPTTIGSRMLVTERLDALVDRGTFLEDGGLANALEPGFDGDGVVTGTARVDGRRVAVVAHDASVKSGLMGMADRREAGSSARARSSRLAPLVLPGRFRGRSAEPTARLLPRQEGAAHLFHLQVQLSGHVPQLCCLFGPSAAGRAYVPALCDWVGMVDGQASMCLGSSRIVEIVTGERVTLEDMCGAAVHVRYSGCADQRVGTDGELLAAARTIFSYLPSDCHSLPPATPATSPATCHWHGVVPESDRLGYDIREVMRRLFDEASFFEVKAEFAAELVTGFARLEGRSVGVVANQPSVKGGPCSSSPRTRRRSSSPGATRSTCR